MGPVKGGVRKLQIFLEEKKEDIFRTSSAKNQGEPPLRPQTQFGIGILIKGAMSKGGYTSCSFLVVKNACLFPKLFGLSLEPCDPGILGP